MLSRYLLAGAALLLAGTTPAAAAVVRVTVNKLTFTPAQVTVRVGDTVEWVNTDFIAHTATARNKAWDVTLARGKSGRVEMKTAGTFDYFCRYHPNMTGKIVVQAK